MPDDVMMEAYENFVEVCRLQICLRMRLQQGDTARCLKPPVDCKTKVPFSLGLPWPSQAKAELMYLSQGEFLTNVPCHPVVSK